MMNFTFNFFYPVVTAFTTLWAATMFTSRGSDSNAECAPNVTVPQQSNRSRSTRISRSTEVSGLRRSARLQHKYVVPEKPILSAYKRPRRLRREGAIANIQPLKTEHLPNSDLPNTSRRQLQREDSFILVDYGTHFRMVKPAYAKRYCQSVPENIRTVAPFHALGPDVGEEELRQQLLAVSVATPQVGRKRVRFKEEEEKSDVECARPRKRRRTA